MRWMVVDLARLAQKNRARWTKVTTQATPTSTTGITRLRRDRDKTTADKRDRAANPRKSASPPQIPGAREITTRTANAQATISERRTLAVRNDSPATTAIVARTTSPPSQTAEGALR